MEATSAILSLTCPDQIGVVASVSNLIAAHNGNIVHADQHTATTHNLFLQRIELTMPDLDQFKKEFVPLAESFQMQWNIWPLPQTSRIAILASKEGHCVADILSRVTLGELNAEVCFVAANHQTLEATTQRFATPFHHIDVKDQNQTEHEHRIGALIDEAKPDLIVLARYMRILTTEFVKKYEGKIINIHHSFLPAFIGAKPYHQAHERGVKIIGATAHYATSELDEGPIIAQDVSHISHRDNVERLKARGRDIEKTVLAKAIRLHLEHRIIRYGNRTVVFD